MKKLRVLRVNRCSRCSTPVFDCHRGIRIGEAKKPGPVARRRGTTPQFQDIIMLNTSGLPQLHSALGHYKREKDGVKVSAMLLQEHHAGPGALGDLQLKAKGKGWRLHGTEAVRLDSGYFSAGVAIATREHVNLGLPPGWAHDISPASSPGRLCTAWLEGFVKGRRAADLSLHVAVGGYD